MVAPRFSLARLVTRLTVCTAVAASACVLAVVLGEQPLTWSELFTEGSDTRLFVSLRIPRVALAALVGAALAASGGTLQALLRNPLADPFVLGVSGGAALGATVALAFGLSALPFLPGVGGLALLGALGAMALVLTVGRLARGEVATTTLLAGVIFNAFALAAIIFIKALVAPDKLGEILFWLVGSLGLYVETSTLLGTGAVVLAAIGVQVALAPRLNLLMLGEEDAQSLGVNVARTRLWLLVAASVAVAAAASLTGLIGFVGLLVPQLVRLTLGEDLRLSLPASALLGAAFLVLADMAARLLLRVFHTEPPVGVITALLGGPLFLVLMTRRQSPR